MKKVAGVSLLSFHWQVIGRISGFRSMDSAIQFLNDFEKQHKSLLKSNHWYQSGAMVSIEGSSYDPLKKSAYLMVTADFYGDGRTKAEAWANAMSTSIDNTPRRED